MKEKELKWFEKKWFVNLKIRTRLNLCFLLIAAITTIAGVVGALYFALKYAELADVRHNNRRRMYN